MSFRYSKFFLVLFTLSFILALNSCNKDGNTSACNENSGTRAIWTAYLGDSDTIPAFPDRYANYWAYGFSRATMPQLGIRITGQMPNARYMSVNVYDMGTQNSEVALLDELVLTCSNNAGSYVLNVVSSTTNTTELENVLMYDATVDSIAIMLRYYLPEEDAQGGKELPLVHGFDTETDEEMSLPTDIPLTANLELSQLEGLVAPFFLLEEDTAMWFYNINPDGLYANLDNQYLSTPITPQADEVYLIRFKAPEVNADVRYWSLSQGNQSTYTFNTLNDADAIVAADGFVNVVIATPDPEIISKSAGLNLFTNEVPQGNEMVIIYRNLYTNPDFEGDIANVPRFTIEISELSELHAQNHIGAYGPIGRRMSRQDFLDDFGGFPVSYP